MQSGAIRCNPVLSGAIRCNPVLSGAIRCNPVPSGATRCHPVPSCAIRCHPVLSDLQELRAAQVEHELRVDGEVRGEPKRGGVVLDVVRKFGHKPDEHPINPS